MHDDKIVRVPIEDAIDLHAFHARDILFAVEDYLHAAAEKGRTIVRLIHGRGRGVQRAAIRRMLTGHPLVEDFWDAPETHLGATVVRLKAPVDPPASAPSP
jgi:DNA-nicking Smr family endonuclease